MAQLPLLVGVAGPSSSGKTTLCQKFVERKSDAAYLCIDDFYKDAGKVPRFNDGTQEYDNWDALESLHLEEFLHVLETLKSGRGAEIPVYEIAKERRVGMRYIAPAPQIVVDGFLLYATKELQGTFDIRFFIDVDEENLRQRRIERNIDYIPNYFDNVVLPEFHRIGKYMRDSAHYVLDGNKDRDAILSDFEKVLRERAIF